MRVVAVGALAQAALRRTGGRARVLSRLSASTYLTAGGEIVWLGPPDAALHPRAILAAGARTAGVDEIEVDALGLVPWRPVLPALDARTVGVLRDGWERLVASPGALGEPDGFGALLAGRPLAFPLAGAQAAVAALAGACGRDDATGAADAAVALLGLGGGLTPSGDDLAGGALFVRHLLATAGRSDAPAWRHAARAVAAAARARTHPVSAALLGDLAVGLGWAPLHDLVGALARGEVDGAVQAARRLTGLGHTSGWDLLAGLGAGLGALPGIGRA